MNNICLETLCWNTNTQSKTGPFTTYYGPSASLQGIVNTDAYERNLLSDNIIEALECLRAWWNNGWSRGIGMGAICILLAHPTAKSTYLYSLAGNLPHMVVISQFGWCIAVWSVDYD